MLYRLIFLTGTLKGQRITVDNAPMTIGKDAECSIKLTDSEVASKHATLEHNALTGLHISDLGSMNKILVNNHEIRKSHLKHGDIVELGRTRFLVQAAVETDLTKNAPNRRRRPISLTPLLIIIPMLVIIYGVVSFSQRIVHESSQTAPRPLVVSLPASNTVSTQAVLIAKKPDDKPPNYPPPNDSLKPISEEIRQMREDLVGIKKTVKDLTVKPATAETSAVTSAVKPPAQIKTPVQAVQTVNTADSTTDRKAPAPAPAKIERINPDIKISDLEQQKFQENEDFDEMRIITIGLQREWPVKNMSDDDIKVEVSFFDQSADGKSIVPTRAITPTKPLKPAQWLQDKKTAVTAAYVIPKGFRTKPSPNSASEQFYGYLVRVYYRNTLQDEDARPKDLLNYSTGTSKKQGTRDNAGNANSKSP